MRCIVGTAPQAFVSTQSVLASLGSPKPQKRPKCLSVLPSYKYRERDSNPYKPISKPDSIGAQDLARVFVGTRSVRPRGLYSASLERSGAPWRPFSRCRSTSLSVRLLVTRPERDGERTATALRERGHEVVLAALMRIEPIANAPLGEGPWSGLVMTSANALSAVTAHSRRAGPAVLRRTLGAAP